ncbi:sugar ABC transporter ATP-binding protein [Rhizobium tubonense]|nr:sugar ABC transporter ATP-binding protein [Rhizobium tubonense]
MNTNSVSGPSPVMLSMSGVEKRFGGVVALSGADLEIGHGEVHALVGENGAGKSTLIKVLTGYHRRDAGQFTFLGQPFDVADPKMAQARGIATIYQEINLVGFRSVAENVCLGRPFGRFGFINWTALNAEAERLLGRLNLSIDVRRPLEDFSIATQQMVAIARTLGFSSRLVIMDEPTSSLNDREVEVLFNVIRQLKSEGVSVVFVSHKLDELYAICDRVTILRDGRTVKTAAMSEISKLELVAAMLGKDLGRIEKSGVTGFGSKSTGQHEPLLAAQGLAHRPRVHDVSFSVGKGEIVGISGLLGAGRTETTRLVFGMDKPESGSFAYKGTAFAPVSPKDAIAAGIGYCTEDRKGEGIIPLLSVRENLTLALLPMLTKNGIVDEAKQKQVVDRFIKRFGIKCSSPEQPIRELSGGNQQKVLLARWLALDPELLILDEPTRGIDVGAKAEIQALIRELAEKGLGVLMVSSEIEEIVEGSDKAYILRDGRTVATLKGDGLTADAMLGAMAHGADPASPSEVAQGTGR